jgi:putative ABC transport system permease protein
VSYIELTYTQVALAALLMLINAAISLVLRLGLERTLLLASLRTVVQLSLLGLGLQWVFQVDRWYVVLAIMLVMTLIAGYTAKQRTARPYSGILVDCVLSMWISSWIVAAFALIIVLHGPNRSLSDWYQPQYAIPLLGMILGNTLNGISVGLKSFTDALHQYRDAIEGQLALGATRWEAAMPVMQDSIRTGMIPILNSMMIVGVVSLPGMMTGQLLSGTEPSSAVKYQIVIMFMIGSATAIGTVGVVLLCFRRLFTQQHQLRQDRWTV